MYRYRDPVARTVSGLMRGTAGTARAAHANGATIYNMGLGNLLPKQYQNSIVSDKTLADGTTQIFAAPNIDFVLADSTIRDETVEVYLGGILQSQNFVGDGSTTSFVLQDTIVDTPVVLINQNTQVPEVDYTVKFDFQVGYVLEFITIINAIQITAGSTCTITFVGTTDFTLIGASSNTVGVTFKATGTGIGTGTVSIPMAPMAKSIIDVCNYAIVNDSPCQIDFVNTPAVGLEVTISVRRGVWWYNVATEAQKQQSLQESNNPAARFLRGL
jgi:hypothetical protein